MTLPIEADFTSFFHAEFQPTVRSIQRVAGDAAEDVAQEAFIAAFGRWSDVSGLEAPDAWVRLVARRIAWRRHGRERDRSRLEAHAAANPESQPPIGDDGRLDLQRAIAGLSTRERAVVRLHYQADLSISRIAELLGCTETAVKVNLFRARERLGDLLLGLRGLWSSAAAWHADDVVAQLRARGDERHADVVIEEVPLRGARWTLEFDRGRYAIETEDRVNLDSGRYRVSGGRLELVPWNEQGRVLIETTIVGRDARFLMIDNTTPPTRGVPDTVYLRLLLEGTSFDRSGDPSRQAM